MIAKYKKQEMISYLESYSDYGVVGMCGGKGVSQISFIVKHLLNTVVKLSMENKIFKKILCLIVFNQRHNLNDLNSRL